MSMVDKDNSYFRFCEILFKEWKRKQFEGNSTLSAIFQLDYAPEPYFTIKNGNNPLYMLLTNPGEGMDFQKHTLVNANSYEKFSNLSLKEYTSEYFMRGAPNAYRRIQKSINLSEKLGYNGLVNIETIPFHSESLNKNKALSVLKKSETLTSYSEELKHFLADKAVLIVSACGSKKSIGLDTIKNSRWLMHQVNLAGIKIEELKMQPITIKNNKVTSALFSHEQKHISLMMGSNNLPNV
jgi:hypothetical protein